MLDYVAEGKSRNALLIFLDLFPNENLIFFRTNYENDKREAKISALKETVKDSDSLTSSANIIELKVKPTRRVVLAGKGYEY